MERTVKVTVNAAGGISPATAQYAGVQGEHNVCRVVFDVAAWAAESFCYRAEFVGGDGVGGTTALLDSVDGCVSFWLPAAWTAAGGRAVARLVASQTADGEESQTVFVVDVPLYFAAKQEYDCTVRDEIYNGLSGLAEKVQKTVDTVEERLADGSFVGPPGPRGASGVYVGGGAMPADCNVQIDPTGEAAEDADLPSAFELVASGELAAAQNGVVITRDANGDPFALRDMITVYLYAPKAAQNSALSVALNDKTNIVYQIANGVKSDSARYSRAVCVYTGKRWDTYGYSTDSATANGTVTTRDRFGKEDADTVNAVYLYLYNEENTLPPGFKYEIYARRAQ